MELRNENGKWFWVDGYATSQDFDSKEDALLAKDQEDAECIRLGLDPARNASAGILDWEY